LQEICNNTEYLFNYALMKNKTDRLNIIKEIVTKNTIGSQEDLLKALIDRGFELTQATLSRDLKRLKISRSLTDDGKYRYNLPVNSYYGPKQTVKLIGVNSIEFSGSLAIMKTRTGYASGIAAEIDQNAAHAILGTIAGDDTILIIPREGFSRTEITNILSNLIENN
jgi:transcriptional regulator of arginine metabolism